LIEVKAAALDLNDSHLRQTLNYGANLGIEWLVLTNGIDWQLHKTVFTQPIKHEEVARFSLTTVSAQKHEDLQLMFLLAREGMVLDAMNTFHQRSQLLNKFMVAQLLISEGTVAMVRRDLRKLFPDLKVSIDQIQELIWNDVLKREVLEGEKVKEAQNRIKRASGKLARALEKARISVTHESDGSAQEE
jgi:predicted type IV restriction endonuclease